MACRGEPADIELVGIDAVFVCVAADEADRSREVIHRLLHDGLFHQLVGRVGHDEAVVAELVETLCDDLSFGRHDDRITAAGKHDHAGMDLAVIQKVRPHVGLEPECQRVSVFAFVPESDLFHIVPLFAMNGTDANYSTKHGVNRNLKGNQWISSVTALTFSSACRNASTTTGSKCTPASFFTRSIASSKGIPGL